jgi:hypothetical protein
MKRTLAVATMLALMMSGVSNLYAGTSAQGVITGTMRGPGGPVGGVRVNVLDMKGSILGSTTTSGNGSYTLEGLPAGTFMIQAVSPTGTVMTTSVATLSSTSQKSTANLAAATSPAYSPAAGQAAAAASGSFGSKTLWWMVGAGAATAGIISAVALEDPASPVH